MLLFIASHGLQHYSPAALQTRHLSIVKARQVRQARQARQKPQMLTRS